MFRGEGGVDLLCEGTGDADDGEGGLAGGCAQGEDCGEADTGGRQRRERGVGDAAEEEEAGFRHCGELVVN